MDEEYEYFKSEEDKILFLLLCVDGKRRNEMLGIRRVHYVDKKKAKRWYKALSFKIHPDRLDHPKSEEGIKALNELYHMMTY